MLNTISKVWSFFGYRVRKLLIIDFFVGIFWFLIESGFLFVFQGFLLSIKAMGLESLKLPDWYPKSLEINLLILVGYGFFRALLTGAKKIIPSISSQIFVSEKRRRILESSFYNYQGKSTSEVISAFGDLSTNAGLFVFYVSSFLSAGTIILLLLVLSLKLAFIETVISLSLLTMVMIPLKIFNKRIKQDGEGLVREWKTANKILVEGLKNIFLLKIYNLLDNEYSNGTKKIEAYERHYSRYLILNATFTSVPLFLGLVVVAVVSFISQKSLHTNPFYFLAFIYLFLRIAQNSSQLYSSWSNLVFYKEPFWHLYQWTSFETNSNKLKKLKVVQENIASRVDIKFENVAFNYPQGKKIFDHLNLALADGEFLLLKGPSGVGKSTLIKLLTGLESPQTGEVLINDIEPKKFIHEYSKCVGYVGPEPYLIPGSVKENLLYGNHEEVSEDRIWEMLTKFGMYDVIKNYSKGLDEVLYEDTQLSTGQKQRLSFARAMLRNPRLLILDEATANIDLKTESLIIEFLKAMKGNVTTVAVSHRESLDVLADKKILLT